MLAIERSLQHYLSIRAQDAEDKAQSLNLLTPKLRFGRNRLIISDLADGYFCEQFAVCENSPFDIAQLPPAKQELAKEQLSDRQSHADKGDALHAVEDSTSEHIRGQLVRSIYKDILISGQTDELSCDGKVVTITDHKFKQRIPMNDPFDNHATQLRAYAYCLVRMLKPHPEFSTLTYRLVAHYHSTVDDSERIYPITYNEQKMLSELLWAYPFWMNQRPAKPTKSSGKCAGCCFHMSICDRCPCHSS